MPHHRSADRSPGDQAGCRVATVYRRGLTSSRVALRESAHYTRGMATDRETKALLKALVDGQVKLAEGQTQLSARVDHLAARLDTFAEKITTDITRLTGRLDAFAEVVVRGFTESAGRDIATDKRVDGLEARVAKLEQR